MRVSGQRGYLRVGYQWAAGLGAWEIAPSGEPRTFQFTSTVLDEHDYWMRQTPIDLVLSLGTAEWVWRDVTLVRERDAVTIVLTERPVVDERVVVDGSRGERR